MSTNRSSMLNISTYRSSIFHISIYFELYRSTLFRHIEVLYLNFDISKFGISQFAISRFGISNFATSKCDNSYSGASKFDIHIPINRTPLFRYGVYQNFRYENRSSIFQFRHIVVRDVIFLHIEVRQFKFRCIEIRHLHSDISKYDIHVSIYRSSIIRYIKNFDTKSSTNLLP